MFCITNKSSSGDNYKITLEGFQPGDRVVEVLRCAATTADGVGSFASFQYDGEPRVYVSQDSLKDSGICTTTVEAKAKEGAASGLVAKGGLAVVAAAWATLLLA